MIRPGNRVAVVGGGLLGLTLAWRLAGRGVQVIVYESDSSPGGLAAGWTIPTDEGPVGWDRYYHVILESDAAWRGVLAEIGLDDEIRWAQTRTGYFGAGRLVDASTPRDLLRLPGLGPLTAGRIGLTVARGMTARNWRALEAMPVERWLTRWSGRRGFREFWRPLLATKLGEGWADTNAAFIWATIQRLTAARRAGIGVERFGAMPGGYGRAVATLATRLAEAGVEVRTGTPVTAIAGARERPLTSAPPRSADGTPHPIPSPIPADLPTVTAAGSVEPFDHVVVTTTPRVAARLVADLPTVTAAAWRDIRYQGVVVASLILRRPLSPYYLTYLLAPLPFTAIVEMTALIPPEWVGGHSLVYLPRYCAPGDEWFERPDDEVVDGFVAALERVHPGATDAVVASRVARTAEVFPMPVLRYSELAPAETTGVAGVSLVSSAQIVNGTLNVNETVRRADAAFATLIGTDSADSLGSGSGGRR